MGAINLCGIVGCISEFIDKEKLQSATSMLAHRGPDDSGVYTGKYIGLGHRRLSIIDLSEKANQPMTNEDNNIILVYNGELYNVDEIKKGLKQKHIFKSSSDSEVIIHAYEEEGPDFVKKLNGMFVFIIYDKKIDRLFIARDRAGIKPLYYYHDSKSFIFASEIKALFELGAKKELNKNILPDFFNYQISIGDETLFKDIFIFPQGHCGYVHSQDDYEFNEYWKPSYTEEERTNSVEQLKEILTGTVQRQMVSDVPVGTFLSGGLDSSLITAIAAKLYSQRESEMSPRIDAGMALSTGKQVSKQHLSADTYNQHSRVKEEPKTFELSPKKSDMVASESSSADTYKPKVDNYKLKTFTAGFEGYEDEINNAKAASLSLGTEHHSVLITPKMFVDALPELIYQYDQPLSFASSVALYFVSKLASDNGVKVILSGEGADELFAGYSRYKRLCSILSVTNGTEFPLGNIWLKIAEEFTRDPRYLKTIELMLKGNNYDYLTGTNSIIGKERDKYLLKSDNKNKNHPLRAIVKKLYEENKVENELGGDILNKLLYLDWHTYLQELLTKQDRMSMSASIESRVPFLDNEVIDFANSLNPGLKLFGKTGKYILRLVAKDILPKEIIKRKKIGFTVPLDDWFRGPLYEYLKEQLNDPIVYEYFSKEYVTTLLEQQKKHNCSLQLWAMLNFKIWHHIYFKDGRRTD
jgi:asparagine synthase (glutamine-hydrolysing)